MKGLIKENKLLHDMDLPVGANVVMCVYGLTFCTGEFYIGSTLNYRQRIINYRTQFNTGNFTCSNLTEAFKKCSSAKIECLEVVENKNDLLETESEYIKFYMGEPGCLNKSSDPLTNKGTRWTIEQRENLSIRMKEILRARPATQARMKMS